MTKKPSSRSGKSDGNPSASQVEAVLSIDSRGQIVIPKEVRNRANIRDGDKLALVIWMNRDETCCLALIQTDNLYSGDSGVMQSLLTENNEGVT